MRSMEMGKIQTTLADKICQDSTVQVPFVFQGIGRTGLLPCRQVATCAEEAKQCVYVECVICVHGRYMYMVGTHVYMYIYLHVNVFFQVCLQVYINHIFKYGYLCKCVCGVLVVRVCACLRSWSYATHQCTHLRTRQNMFQALCARVSSPFVWYISYQAHRAISEQFGSIIEVDMGSIMHKLHPIASSTLYINMNIYINADLRKLICLIYYRY